MRQLTINPDNRQYYSEDFIKGFNCGAHRQFEADKSDADRPQGEWVPFEYGDERWHKCTACGVADKYIEYVERPNGTTGKLVAIRNYCPNCGARMFAKDTNVLNKEGADDGDQ